MSTTTTSTPTQVMAGNLAALADLLATTELPFAPYVTTLTRLGAVQATWHVDIYCPGGLAEQKAMTADIVRSLGGGWDKAAHDYDDGFDFTQVRDGLTLRVNVNRAAVCERVVTGTREVTRTLSAVEAQPERTVTEVVEDVTWECGPLLADAEAVA